LRILIYHQFNIDRSLKTEQQKIGWKLIAD